MTTRALAVACLFLFASHAGAQEAAADPDAVVRELLELSGQRKLLEQLLVQNQGNLAQARKELSPQEYKLFEARMKEAFQVDPLYQKVFEHHRSVYDAKKATALLEWLKGPLGRKILEAQLQAMSAKDEKARQQYLRQVQAKPLPATREALIERVQEANRAMEITRRTVTVMVRSTMTASNATLPADKRKTDRQIDETILRLLSETEPVLRQSVRLSMLSAFRELADDELRAYIQFLDSELGRWYVRTGVEANMKAIELASTKVGEALAQAGAEKREEKTEKKKKAPKRKKRGK